MAKRPFGTAWRFVAGFFIGVVSVSLVHRLIFFHTLLPDPNRQLAWHDWVALVLEIALGLILGVGLAVDQKEDGKSS